MAHLIDKSALVAEIERRMDFASYMDFERYSTLESILSFVKEELEVKEEVTTTDAFLKKACDWLTKHAKKYYFNKERYLGTDELVEDFKLSMEL